MFDVIIKNSDSLRVASLRKIYANKNEAMAQVNKMRKELPQNILGKRDVIINYETEYCEKDFDLAACVELVGGLPRDCDYTEKIIDITSDAATLVINQSELNNACAAMTKQLNEMSYQLIGATYEIYYDDGTVEIKIPVFKLSQLYDKHNDDDIDIPFENDPDVIGKWDFVDTVPSVEQFNAAKIKSQGSVWMNELYFLPEGCPYWAVAGWTKGFLLISCYDPEQTYKIKYTIKTVGGQKLLFLEMKEYDYEARGGLPTIWIYKKVSNQKYTKDEICTRDNVDLPFIPDNKIIGKWIVRDFVLQIQDFLPNKRFFPKEKLFFIYAEFKADGIVVETLEPPAYRRYTMNWTKGMVIDKNNHLASEYEIKTIDGKEYLFIEWKSGDYQYGGLKPYYYVFTRE